jgi:hypothetical protein
MANTRKVNLQIEVTPTFGFYFTDADAKKAQIRDALVADGWDIQQISGGASLFAPNFLSYVVEANVLNNSSDEQIRQRAFFVLDRLGTIISYGVTTSTIKSFSDINVRIIKGDMSYRDASEINENQFLKNFAMGLGVSTPAALVIGALGIVVILKLTR